ncbi:MAG: methyltransferase domain-containing protein [Actinophytocola sp.]|nr:methyltransferase domain-containing protein [Actinophytocola sp.]
MFFDDYPKFLETSKVYSKRGRLNLRYEAIFAANADILDGARVLDLASHDGRWSFAALRTGAAHVTGIEARRKAVESANETFSYYDVDREKYRFVCGDVYDVLRREDFDVDVVLCLGYMYHTYRQTELLYRIRQIDPEYLLVDSTVVPDQEEPFVKLYVDRPQKPGEATLDAFSHGRSTLVGRPSVPALRMMLRTYDFEIEDTCDWHALMAEYPEAGVIGDYAEGKRVTMRCRSGFAVPPNPGPTTSENGHGRWSAGPSLPATATASIVTEEGQVEQGAPSKRWRELVNRGLARTTGYEFRRSDQEQN